MLNFTCGKVEDEGPDKILRVGILVSVLAKTGFYKEVHRWAKRRYI